MRTEASHAERPIGPLAGDQVFTTALAMQAGTTYRQVRRELASGAWVRVVARYLAHATTNVSLPALAHPVVSGCPDAVVVFRTTRLHGLPVEGDGEVHVARALDSTFGATKPAPDLAVIGASRPAAAGSGRPGRGTGPPVT